MIRLKFQDKPKTRDYFAYAEYMYNHLVDIHPRGYSATHSHLFQMNKTVYVSRAPGRLDVMGGISDYSGGLVLQLPLLQPCLAAAQLPEEPYLIQVVSRRADGSEHRWFCLARDLDACQSYEEAKNLFAEKPWVGYIAGCLTVLKFEGYITSIPSISLFILSYVPEGSGVSSSAAVEIATMMVLDGILELQLDHALIAALCQKVENIVVGAPCGIMDQMTAMFGQEDHLLALSCRPNQIVGQIKVPEGFFFAGIDSGEKHSISGEDYDSVRAGAFMGLKILRESGSLTKELKYLTELDVKELEEVEENLPVKMSGQEFVNKYGEHIDDATKLDMEREYPVRQATSHPIREIARVREFWKLIEEPEALNNAQKLGELMYASHEAYCKLNVDSKWTSYLVELAKNDSTGTLHGGKITGGGSGGSVCFLTSTMNRDRAINQLRKALRSAKKEHRDPTVFWKSSHGASTFGTRKVILEADF